MPEAADPIDLFVEALERMRAREPEGGAACALATAGADHRPSVRMVLLRRVDRRGFVFHTNRESRKGAALAENPRGALCFWWPSAGEQARVEGGVELLPDEESDAYFAGRDRESQLAAWASRQSAPLASRGELEERWREAELRFRAGAVPRPPFWGGYLLTPDRVELWRDRAHRLHERTLFVREAGGWHRLLLYP